MKKKRENKETATHLDHDAFYYAPSYSDLVCFLLSSVNNPELTSHVISVPSTVR